MNEFVGQLFVDDVSAGPILAKRLPSYIQMLKMNLIVCVAIGNSQQPL